MSAIYFGDCRDVMQVLIRKRIKAQCCVTSPPYYGLRDYGCAGQIGLEETPDQYVATMVDVFSQVRELLSDDGVLWLNLGDSYCTRPNGVIGHNSKLNGGKTPHAEYRRANALRSTRVQKGLKHKDQIGIPWRVAFALQADGWYLRSDIIWHKPNPMPESVTDRPTKSHEYIFLLSKSAKYYYDFESIKEPDTGQDHKRNVVQPIHRSQPNASPHRGLRCDAGRNGKGRNKRSVWTVPTKPYSGAHFAVFPPELIEPCVLAGSRAGDIVLDPFFGSGTTGAVAQKLGRQYIGIELNENYKPLQNARLSQLSLGLECAEKVKPAKNPRYDDVYFDGLTWLDSL